MKKIIALLLLVVFASCKAKKAIIEEPKESTGLSSEKIIEKHSKGQNAFSTLYIKSNANYKNNNQSQNVTAEIKIKKDEKILISIRFLGITMAKALITPTEVKYYEKINGSFFEGNYSALSQWLGTDLDFNKVQNILIGQSLNNLNSEKLTMVLENNLYKLTTLPNESTNKIYYFEEGNLMLKKQEISQQNPLRTVHIMYSDRKEINQINLPSTLLIEAIQQTGTSKININYNTITVNEELSFPYSVPESYERVYIN
jgi:hypothetical protein